MKSTNYPSFDPKELEISGVHKCGMVDMLANMGLPQMPESEPLYHWPISPKENFRRLFQEKKPCWTPRVGWAYCEINPFEPRLLPDNIGAHIISDGEPSYDFRGKTLDTGWLGLEWLYVPEVGGSTVKPGNPLIEDMNDWEKILKWPDLDALDWEGMAEKNKEYLNTPQLNELHLLNGLWERLISLMDVSGAAIAMIDEDQQDAVKSFFDRYADLLIEVITRVKKICDIDCVLIHDDWGTQNGPFFSLDTVREMIVPYMKRIVDAIHDMGMFYEHHCCGKAEALVPAMIECGMDFWCPQTLNDIDKLLDLYPDSCLHYGSSSGFLCRSLPVKSNRIQ